MATPLAQQHFIDTFGDYLNAVVDQAVAREKGYVLSIKDYMIIRRVTIGIHAACPILELDMDLNEEVWNHSVIKELKNVAADMVFLDNVGDYL